MKLTLAEKQIAMRARWRRTCCDSNVKTIHWAGCPQAGGQWKRELVWSDKKFLVSCGIKARQYQLPKEL